MEPITDEEVLAVIRENPMICTRAIVKRLRPEEFKDNKTYLEYIENLKPTLMRLWKDGYSILKGTVLHIQPETMADQLIS